MKLLLDENLPKKLKQAFGDAHQVFTVGDMIKLFILFFIYFALFTSCNYQKRHSPALSRTEDLLTPLNITLKSEVLSALKKIADTCNKNWDSEVFLVVVRQNFENISLGTFPIERYIHFDKFFPEHYLFKDILLFLFSNGENRLMRINKSRYLQNAEAIIGNLLLNDIENFDENYPAIYCPPTAIITIEKDTVYTKRGEEANIWDIPQVDTRPK